MLFSPQVRFKHLWGLSTGLMARSSLIGPLVQHSNLKWIYSVTSPYFSNSIIVVSTHISQCTYFKLVITKLLMNFTFQHFFSVFPSYYILFAHYTMQRPSAYWTDTNTNTNSGQFIMIDLEHCFENSYAVSTSVSVCLTERSTLID